MATGPRTRVPFRRRREGRTDYRARLGLLKSNKTRMVVRRTNGNVIVQFADWDGEGDRVLASATARELAKQGWKHSPKSTPAAYLAGYLAGQRARKAGVENAVLDIGRHAPVRGSKVFAALKGALDAGVEMPHGDDKFPSEERLNGAFLGQENDFNAVVAALGGTAAAKSNDEEEE